MTTPDPNQGEQGARGSSYYYPEHAPKTREYSASEYRSQQHDDAARQSERAEAQRRARREAAQRRDHNRVVAARTANTVIQVVCYVFAAVLAIHIVLIIGNANAGNGFFQFINSWSGGITLGFDDLFVPDNYKFRIVLNEGLAAIVWIIVGIVLSTLVKRLVMPVPRNYQDY